MREVIETDEEDVYVTIRLSDGRAVKGKKLSFKSIKEEWNEYELEDGTKLFVKLVLVDVVREVAFNDFGEPIYHIRAQNIIRVKPSKKAIEEVQKTIQKMKKENDRGVL